MIAASKGYRFLCVTDRRCNLTTRLMMEALGARVHVIDEPDPVGGFVGARIDYVRAAVRRRRPVRLAQPVLEPEQLDRALPAHRPGDRAPVPAAGRPVRRGRNHRNPDGLRALLPRVAPAGADRRGGHGRLGDVRNRARTAG